MSEAIAESPTVLIPDQKDRILRTLGRRHAGEKRFRVYGIVAICFALAMLAILLATIVWNGYSAFFKTWVQVEIHLTKGEIAQDGKIDHAILAKADYETLLRDSLIAKYKPESRLARRRLTGMVSVDAGRAIRDFVLAHPNVVGTTQQIWVPASADIDQLVKGRIDRRVPEADRRVKNDQLAILAQWEKQGRVETRFNTGFFTHGDSREPEQAGFWGALVGSFFTMIVTLLLAFPIGVATAVYLEEFAPKNRATDLIEVNINNLAAVPSIVFGLLGLAVFLNFFELPRSAPLVGGMVLALMTLPTIIISGRAALKAVPPSIREAAYGLGASRLQVVSHHVLPLSMPGILTGTIIGMAQALGETAPLLMIGMVAFVVDIPGGPMDAATVMPVQVFLWADSPERAFVEKTSGGIIVLLTFLIVMNALAIFLRKKFERRW
jgi:phosphate transport system permease protein